MKRCEYDASFTEHYSARSAVDATLGVTKLQKPLLLCLNVVKHR
jgi:hypothetical protein